MEDIELRAGKIARASNLGERFSTRKFETWNRSRFPYEYQQAKMYAESIKEVDGRGLIFCGSVGTGKTHLASAVANYVLKNEPLVSVKFISVSELMNDLRRAMKSDENVLAKTEDVQLLILDDIGKEKPSDWTNEQLFNIVNYRYEHQLPTVFTCNYTLSQLAGRIGGATVSRMTEVCDVLVMDGDDFRIKSKGARA